MIATDFMMQKPLTEIAEHLKQVYHGGNGFEIDGAKISVWYGDDGIRMARGAHARHQNMVQLISWEDAAKRIHELMDDGTYATMMEIAGAPAHERKKLAESIWHLHHDIADGEKEWLTTVQGIPRSGFPEETALLADQLANPAFAATLTTEVQVFVRAYEENHDLLRFLYHRPRDLLERMQELALPRRDFSSQLTEILPEQQFITDDEINALLAGGSHYEGGSGRIYRYFSQLHTTDEKAAFLKSEYGTGGRSHAISRSDGSDEWHDAKGIRLKKRGCADVQLNWKQAAKRIDDLMRKDRYLTADAMEKLQAVAIDEPVIPDTPVITEQPMAEPADEMDAEVYTRFKPVILQHLIADSAYVNACQNADEENIRIEAEAAIHRAANRISDMDFIKLYFDDPDFHTRLHDEVLEESYQMLSNRPEETVRLMPEQPNTVIEILPAQNEPLAASVPSYEYSVGDTVYLDNTAFNITEIRESTIQLQDPTLYYPIFRAESRDRFEQLLKLDARNAAMLPTQDEKDVQAISVPKSAAGNFHITDNHLGEGGAKTKFDYNLTAIRALKQIESENRRATPEEQETLSRYVGWGGIPQAFDNANSSWTNEYAALKDLLTPEEYDAARASTLNAHYTSPVIINAIYEGIQQMGFESGNVLEPACGVGNFFGMLPESMQNSRLYGVELDSISGRISQQLYPGANITVSGFEKTDRKDFFDLAIGNVPFGSYQIQDKAFDKHRFMIHDYFFAKALDQVRPGGVVAFITSKGTMDKRSPEVRKYIAERAELLGAVRLPNNAFRANAGTEVTSDIIFLQKREQPIVAEPDWVHLGETEDGIPVNSYFAEHPEMVLGTLAWDDSMYGDKKETACLPLEGAVLSEQLSAAIQNIQGQYTQAELPDLGEGEAIRATIPADPNVKNYSYTVVDGEVYYRENSIMVRPEMNQTARERIKGLVALRTCTNNLIEAQLADYDDDAIHVYQQQLNTAYDTFTAKHGLINSRTNALAFADDASYYLLCSLEILNEQNELERKADMFTKRTIRKQQIIEHVDTAVEALAVSIAEKACVDIPYMTTLSSKEEAELAKDLTGAIFPLPYSEPVRYVTADEYLSGNVRQKLRDAIRASENNPVFTHNVAALEAAQPKDLDASEIDVRLGATWVDKEYIEQFMYDTFSTPRYSRYNIKVNYMPYTAEWNITGKSTLLGSDVAAYVTFGTERINAYRVLEDTLNLRDVRIYDTVIDADGKEKRVLNQKETMLAQQKQQSIKDAFRDWVWRDPQRREALVTQYNEQFNSSRPREYDGQHLALTGISPEITLREHQRNAVARILYGGNTLLAHVVGAGKTFEMVAATMESKRIGLCQKAMFVVPNHLTEQWASEFLRLYPSANILVTTKKDFEKANRKKFCGRIATGDYDAVIIGHSQFERIPISKERQEQLINDQIDEIVEGIEELKNNHGERFSIKQLERTKKQLETRLKNLQADDKKDDVVTFEQLGVDRLYVDESHAFKNLFLYTKMRNIAGLSTSEAQKSSDMFLKCRYMDEITGGRGVVFATGTPVSNSMTELYTMQRYLQYSTLAQKNLTHFDAWASTFGETVTAIELAPEGTGYRARTRFAKFFNLPELMTMFGEVADIKTAEHLDLDTPNAHYETIAVKPSDYQKEMMKALSERAAEVHKGNVEPTEDNMLKITSDGRKLGLDQRLINPLLPDEPTSKVNACVDNVHRIWDEGQDELLTQLVFCDISTPKGTAAQSEKLIDADIANENFNVYDDIRGKLIAKGIPAEQVAFIHEANTEMRKKELFAKVRSGQVRVLLGSTAKMGAGTNIQDRLIAIHDLDCPWRPGDLEQRAGRIVRQGNQNKDVSIYRYVTEGTFDAYLWQTVENKQKFISQIMSSKNPVRSCDDVDETSLSYAEIKALCAGDPRIKEKMDLDVDVARLRLMKADYQSKQYRLEDQLLKYFPQQVSQDKVFIESFKQDIVMLAEHPLPEKDFVGMEVDGQLVNDKEKAGMAIMEACKGAAHGKDVMVGHYRGFAMTVSYNSYTNNFNLILKGAMPHKLEVGSDAKGNITRIENALAQIPTRLAATEEHFATMQQQIEAAKQEIGKPFPHEGDLKTKAARLAELDASLNMDAPAPAAEQELPVKESVHPNKEERRPSVLESLKLPCIHGQPTKNTAERSYNDAR